MSCSHNTKNLSQDCDKSEDESAELDLIHGPLLLTRPGRLPHCAHANQVSTCLFCGRSQQHITALQLNEWGAHILITRWREDNKGLILSPSMTRPWRA